MDWEHNRQELFDTGLSVFNLDHDVVENIKNDKNILKICWLLILLKLFIIIGRPKRSAEAYIKLLSELIIPRIDPTINTKKRMNWVLFSNFKPLLIKFRNNVKVEIISINLIIIPDTSSPII